MVQKEKRTQIHNYLRTSLAIAVVGVPLAFSGCDKSDNKVGTSTQSPAQTGLYSARYCRLPLNVAEDPLYQSMFDMNGMAELERTVAANTKKGKWTYTMLTPERGYYRVDSFYFGEGDNRSMVSVIYMPEAYENYLDNRKNRRPGGEPLDDTPTQIKIDGQNASMVRYKSGSGRCGIQIEVPKGDAHYAITMSGPDFDGPDKAFKHVIEGIKLK
jgi:hypothetical protein